MLSGGASKRMKTDKARLQIERQGRRHTLLSWTLHRIRQVVPEIAVMDGGHGHLDGLDHARDGVRALPDGPGGGPAAGLLGAWADAPERQLLVLASDLPQVPVSLLEEIVSTAQNTRADWVLTRVEQRLQPLCALYGPAVRSELEEAVATGQRGLWSLYDRTRLHRVVLESRALRAFGDPKALLRNVNTEADYRSLPGASRPSQIESASTPTE
ncbi:MAG: NTP transferase domain-containing protein [Acidobacteriota bacterium]